VDGGSGEAVTVVSIDVTNVGERAGREVVQVYVHAVDEVGRPEKELVDFAALDLAPGETATARFELPDRAFAHWDIVRHGWVAEPGEYEVRVGSSSRDLRSTLRMTRH